MPTMKFRLPLIFFFCAYIFSYSGRLAAQITCDSLFIMANDSLVFNANSAEMIDTSVWIIDNLERRLSWKGGTVSDPNSSLPAASFTFLHQQDDSLFLLSTLSERAMDSTSSLWVRIIGANVYSEDSLILSQKSDLASEQWFSLIRNVDNLNWRTFNSDDTSQVFVALERDLVYSIEFVGNANTLEIDQILLTREANILNSTFLDGDTELIASSKTVQELDVGITLDEEDTDEIAVCTLDSAVTLGVSHNGVSSLEFQWYEKSNPDSILSTDSSLQIGPWDQIMADEEQVYYVWVKSDEGCGFDSIIVDIEYLSLDLEVKINNGTPNFEDDISICFEDAISITASPGKQPQNPEYIWSIDGIVDPGLTGASISLDDFPEAQDNFEVSLEINASNGCAVSSVRVSVNVPGQFDLKPDEVLNCGLVNMLNLETVPAEGSWQEVDGLTFRPNRNTAEAEVEADNYGTYQIIWVSQTGTCALSDSITIHFLEAPIAELEVVDPKICMGDSTIIHVTPPGIDDVEYTWMPITGLDISDTLEVIAAPEDTTTYSLIIKNSNNICADTATETISVIPPPEIVEIIVDTSSASFNISCFDQIILKDSSTISINFINLIDGDLAEWRMEYDANQVSLLQASDTSGTNTVESHTFFLNEGENAATINYFITAVSSSGLCPEDTTCMLTILVSDSVIPPNVSPILTPNDDTYNDFWIIECVGKRVSDFHVRVFNRNGAMVFESEAYDNKWNGGNLPDGVYWYVVEDKVEGTVYRNSLLLQRNINR